jgi:hypothetical protein
LRENNYYGFALGSEYAWNAQLHLDLKQKYNAFQHAFISDFFGMPNYHLLWDAIEIISKINRGGVFSTEFYNQLWEHPFGMTLPSYKTSWAKKDVKQLAIAQEMLVTAKNTITRNMDLIPFLDYTIEVARFRAQKALLSAELYRWGKKDRLIRSQSLPSLKLIRHHLETIWRYYSQLWKSCAKDQGLKRIERNYQSLHAIYCQLIDCAIHRTPYDKPFLSSKWITHPSAKNTQLPFTFRKLFRLTAAQIQALSYAKIQ